MLKNIRSFLADVTGASSLIRHFEVRVELGLLRRLLEDKVLASTESLIDESNKIIVSLTSYGSRVLDVHLVIESLGRQTVKPGKIILWLDRGEFTLQDLPHSLKRLQKRGLEIRFCPDYKSYKKLVPTLKLYPSNEIVTVDDDVLYPIDMLEILSSEACVYENTVIANMAHKITFDDGGGIDNYQNWDIATMYNQPSDLVVPIGMGGVYYPAGALDRRCLDSDVFIDICPTADDLWFKVSALANGVPGKRVGSSRRFKYRFLELESSVGRNALFKYNIYTGRNDVQLAAALKYFGVEL